jgi:hypothetical protein
MSATNNPTRAPEERSSLRTMMDCENNVDSDTPGLPKERLDRVFVPRARIGGVSRLAMSMHARARLVHLSLGP